MRDYDMMSNYLQSIKLDRASNTSKVMLDSNLKTLASQLSYNTIGLKDEQVTHKRLAGGGSSISFALAITFCMSERSSSLR